VTALRLAHRGDWRRAPENSLAAMLRALRNPACDGLELDVRHSLDGIPIVLHDPTLDRVQGLAIAAADLTAIELEALGIPTLAVVLAAAGKRPFLDIELKERPSGACLAVIESARGRPDGRLDHAVVSSFQADPLEAVAAQHAGWPRWLNTVELDSGIIRRAAELGCVGIAANWRAIRPATARAVLAAGLTLAAYTVRHRSTFERLSSLGVSAVCVEAAALDP
jgi:glycerophosphoryl diester phosphodiesterase